MTAEDVIDIENAEFAFFALFIPMGGRTWNTMSWESDLRPAWVERYGRSRAEAAQVTDNRRVGDRVERPTVSRTSVLNLPRAPDGRLQDGEDP
jgi:hypothetical protein